MFFDFPSEMKNTAFAAAVLFAFVCGCQSTRNSQWLTPPRGSGGQQFLGQVSADDPFLNALRSAPGMSNPMPDPFAPVQQSALGSNLAIEEAERERIRTLATVARNDVPDYLKPLNPWDGPFANRVRKKNLEQDIIRQAGFEQVSVKTFSNEPEFDWEKEEPKKGFDWSILAPSKSVSRIRDWMGLGPDENKANELMKKGKDILLVNPDLKDKKKNLEAARLFTEAAKKYPDSVLEEDALHLAAECYFFADDYADAFSAYQKLIIKYQHSKYVDNAIHRVFSIAQYWESESEKSRAKFNFSDRSLPQYDTFGFTKKAYETIFIYDPLGPRADDALMALATAYLKRGQYQGDDNYNQAAFYYQRLREEHPSSKHITKAAENELFARTRAYLGAEHPSRTLDEASKLVELTLWQFRNELNSGDKAAILELKESVLAAQAERLWSQGQFFDLKKRNYGSARVYYNMLITEYPQTEFAERARRRMAQIEGLPDSPPIFGLPINPFKAEG